MDSETTVPRPVAVSPTISPDSLADGIAASHRRWADRSLWSGLPSGASTTRRRAPGSRTKSPRRPREVRRDRRGTSLPGWPARSGNTHTARPLEAVLGAAGRSEPGRRSSRCQSVFGDTQAQQRQQIGQVNEPFCFRLLVGREGRSAVLLVEERLQSPVDSFGQVQPRQVLGYFDREVDLCARAHRISVPQLARRDPRRRRSGGGGDAPWSARTNPS